MKQNNNNYPAPSENYLLLRELYINLGSQYVRNRVDFPDSFLDVGGKLLSPPLTVETLDTLLSLLAQAEKELETKIEDRNAKQRDDADFGDTSVVGSGDPMGDYMQSLGSDVAVA